MVTLSDVKTFLELNSIDYHQYKCWTLPNEETGEVHQVPAIRTLESTFFFDEDNKLISIANY